MKLETGIWVAVCDAGRFLLLQNNGDVDVLDLRIIAHEKPDEGDRPGRSGRGPSPDGSKARTGRAQSQSVEDLAERRFVESIALELEERIAGGGIQRLVLMADPKTLGIMREKLSETARSVIDTEIAADFAHKTVIEIEAAIARH